MFWAFLVMAGFLALVGLGNNRRLGSWLQPMYTQAMDRLQERQDTRYQRATISRNSYFLIGISIVVGMYGFVFWVGSRFGAPAAWDSISVADSGEYCRLCVSASTEGPNAPGTGS